MTSTIADTKDLIATIENARDKVDNHLVLFNFSFMIERLGIFVDFHSLSHFDLIKMFGGDCVGPELSIALNSFSSKTVRFRYKIWYDDNGIEIKRQQLFP